MQGQMEIFGHELIFWTNRAALVVVFRLNLTKAMMSFVVDVSVKALLMIKRERLSNMTMNRDPCYWALSMGDAQKG